MGDAVANDSLGDARKAKNDEFYTQYSDIEKEMNAYLDFNEDVFRDKTVLLPCDDPEWSNFTKYFAQNFERLGLKKLISTSYAPNSKPKEIPYYPPLFELESDDYDAEKSNANGKLFVVVRDVNLDSKINVQDIEWSYLEGDGDFRSEEVTALRDEADIVITNPPFSLFREFLAWIIEGSKDFVLIGNMNAITYKETFRLFADNKMWIGATNFNTGMYFFVPETFVYASTYKFEREIGGKKASRVPGVCWYTTIDHGRRHEPLVLMTEEENIKFSKHKEVKGLGYQAYDNFEGIEVPYADSIPSDFPGVMGVPISFLNRYNPEQFEIIGNMDDHDDMKRLGVRPLSEDFIAGYRAVGGTGAQRAGGYWVGLTNPNRFPYKRIFIRHRKAAQ